MRWNRRSFATLERDSTAWGIVWNWAVSTRSNGPRWADSTTAATTSTARWSHSSAVGPPPNPSRKRRWLRRTTFQSSRRVFFYASKLAVIFIFVFLFSSQMRHNFHAAFVVVFLEIFLTLQLTCNASAMIFFLLCYFSLDCFGIFRCETFP